MTTRERVSVVLVLGGTAAVVVAVGVLGGWWWSLLVGGALAMIFGALLGLEERPADEVEPAEFDELGGPAE